jgi:hypothetical protein
LVSFLPFLFVIVSGGKSGSNFCLLQDTFLRAPDSVFVFVF